MSLQLKVGEYYESRDGKVYGPLVKQDSTLFPFTNNGFYWCDDGSFIAGKDTCAMDLIKEVPAPNDIAINLQPSAEEIAQEICELYNSMPNHAVNGRIEMPAEDLQTLAIAYHKRGDKLLEIRDRVKASIGIQQDLVAEISRLMEGGEA
jgi:hypothetical protein